MRPAMKPRFSMRGSSTCRPTTQLSRARWAVASTKTTRPTRARMGTSVERAIVAAERRTVPRLLAHGLGLVALVDVRPHVGQPDRPNVLELDLEHGAVGGRLGMI